MRTEDAQQLIKDVTELFSQKKALTKADKDAILNKLHHLNMDIGCNMDFIADQFNEQMDKTVMEAKGEIEALFQNKMNSIALATLSEHQEDFKKLENPIDMKIEE